MDTLNVARGQVRLKETQQPIPNVIVELFSKDVFGVFGSSGLPAGASKPFIRLGYVLTDANGNTEPDRPKEVTGLIPFYLEKVLSGKNQGNIKIAITYLQAKRD